MDDLKEYQKAKKRIKEVKGFYGHLASYISVNTGLFMIDLISGNGLTWFYWPMIGWGIGLFSHGIRVFGTQGYLERWEQKELQKLKVQQPSAADADAASFSKKHKVTLGAHIGQEIAHAMKVLERELGDLGLDERDSRQNSASASARAKIPQGVAILMFSDIEGFTAYVESHGDEAGRALLQQHHRIFREHLKRHEGVEIKSMGDGFMLCFTSARKALTCAAQVLADLERCSFPLKVRIGLHAGEPLQEGEDLTGQMVNLAARVMNQADGGQILLTEVVKNLAGSMKGFQYVDQRLRRLPGISQPQQLYQFHPIESLTSPLDSQVDQRLDTLEKQMKKRG